VKLDLALEGFALLFMFSMIFGGAAHIVLARSSTSWMWLVGAAAFMLGGIVASEIFFGNASVEELQPFIGGLAVDESMLGGLALGLPVVLVVWYLARHDWLRRPTAS